MADIFHRDDLRKLLAGKYVLFFGDSNSRALYKDMLTLYHKNKLIPHVALKKKLERSFEGDSLLQSVGLTKGRDYKEHRRFASDQTIIEFFFITKCLSAEVTYTLEAISTGQRPVPDVIVMNSTLWDVTRWGGNSVSLYKKNLQELVKRFKQCLPESTLTIWSTTPPLSKVQKGFLIPEVKFLGLTMRFEAMEANMYVHSLFASNGFDVVDFNYHLNLFVHMREPDGIHWQPKAVRYMTNLLLSHISIAWGVNLPGKFESTSLAKLGEKLRNSLRGGEDEASSARQQLPVHERPRLKAKYRLGNPVVPSSTASCSPPSAESRTPSPGASPSHSSVSSPVPSTSHFSVSASVNFRGPSPAPSLNPSEEDLRTRLVESKQIPPHVRGWNNQYQGKQRRNNKGQNNRITQNHYNDYHRNQPYEDVRNQTYEDVRNQTYEDVRNQTYEDVRNQPYEDVRNQPYRGRSRRGNKRNYKAEFRKANIRYYPYQRRNNYY